MLMRFICLLFTHEQIIANIKLRNSTYTQASSIYMLEAFFEIGGMEVYRLGHEYQNSCK